MPRSRGDRSKREQELQDSERDKAQSEETNGADQAPPGPPPNKLVVVGASAGGIQALSLLVSTLQPDFPAPVVFAQHLDPHRPSNLAEILGRRTSLPVVTVNGPTPLEGGKIYVVPANRHIVINDGHVGFETDHVLRPRPSVDLLLISAARSYGERLIAVVLTGTGADGAVGAVEVKRAGGTVVIQNPQTARYPSMPLALPPTAVDHVVDLENLAHLLNDLVQDGDIPVAQIDHEDALQTVLAIVTRQANIDFRQYKPTTILRRISRRMTATRNVTLGDYATYIQKNPTEVAELVKAFLIKVTEFFRDPDAFRYLQATILPEIIAMGRANGNVLRFWSAGCATGEEAYSLALVAADYLGAELSQWSIKIFATDLDESAIDYARRGLYPENLFANLPEEFRSRYFERVDSGLRINKILRQMVIFGQQDISRGVPFPRMDLVVCRNLLIYFKPELQQQVLEKFAYSLHQTHGFLFLGHAETVRPSQTNFELVNKKWKLYRCLRPPHTDGLERAEFGRAPVPVGRPLATHTGSAGTTATATDTSEIGNLRRFNETALRLLPTGIIVVDRTYRIITINTAARRLFGIRETAIEHDFLHAARGLPYTQVRNAIDTAFRARAPVYLQEMTMNEVVGANRFLTLSIVPVDTEVEGLEAVIINAQDATDAVETRRHLEVVEAEQRQLLQELQTANRRLSDMNKELQDANEELQAANEELMLAQEELQATNEEFEATNEELQATNEELETNNEELQATNEELETTNDELTARTTELQETARALATDRAQFAEMVELAPYYIMVLRGPSLTLEAFNPRYAELFGGNKVLGTPVDAVLADDNQRPLLEKIQAAYRHNAPQTISRLRIHLPTERSAEPERFMTYTIVPIHESGGGVDGLVIYAEDVTEQIAREAQERLDRLRLVIQHADQAALGLYDAATTELLYASPMYRERIARALGHEPEEIIGWKWQDLAPTGDGSNPSELFRSIVAGREPRRLSEVRHVLPDGTETIWDYSLTPILDNESDNWDSGYVVVSAIDITQQVQVRQELERLDQLKDLFLSSASHELRTPLVPLVGYADLLSRLVQRHKDNEGWDPRITDYVSRFVNPLKQLRRLVDDLFDVARLESGKLTVRNDPTNLRAVIDLAAEEARMFSDSHKIEVEAPKSGNFTVMGDEGRLVQVITNLLHNASKYGPDHKPIHLRLRRETRNGAKRAIIEVQDYGNGISPEDLPNVFSRFYQTRQSLSSAEGLGLGLFIARSIIEQHGGTIAANSTVGEGSTFTITLPLLGERK